MHGGEGGANAWERRLELLAHDGFVQRTGETGRRERLLVLVGSAIDTAENNRVIIWAEISLKLVVVAIRFLRKLLQLLEQKRRVER